MWSARTSSCLVIPTLVYMHEQRRAQKNNLRVFGPDVPPRFVFSGVFGFRAFLKVERREGGGEGRGRYLHLCMFDCLSVVCFVFSLRVCICCCICMFVCARLCFLYLYFCARASELVFVFKRLRARARRVNLRDATPIVQSRPARKSNNQTQTDKRTTNGLFFPFRELVWPLETQDGIFCDTHMKGRLRRSPYNSDAVQSPVLCCPRTLQKSSHMTNQPNVRNNTTIARMRHGFRCSGHISM